MLLISNIVIISCVRLKFFFYLNLLVLWVIGSFFLLCLPKKAKVI